MTGNLFMYPNCVFVVEVTRNLYIASCRRAQTKLSDEMNPSTVLVLEVDLGLDPSCRKLKS
jgi:hypothetical protein